jgi:hypothetical protein
MAPGEELPILLELVVPAGLSGITDVATVTASSRTEWAVQASAKDTTLLNNPPHAILAPIGSVPEGTRVTLNASASWDADEQPLKFRWDFNGDGTWDTDWSPNATATYTWGDDYSGTVRVEVTDGELNDTAQTSIHVTNVSPVVTNLTIAPANPGCNDAGDEHGNHDGEHEHQDHGCGDRDDDGCHDDDRDEGCKDGHDEDGCRDGDEDHEHRGRDHSEHDHDKGGCGCRGDDHDDEEGDHDGEHDHDDDKEGNGCGATFTFRATAYDPGSDDLTFFWDFGDGTNASHTYYNNGVSPDPYPSPGPTFPVNVTNETTHTYTKSGNFTVTLTVSDDDHGNVTIVRHVLVCAGGGDEHGDHDGEHEHDDDNACGHRDDDDHDDDHDGGDDERGDHEGGRDDANARDGESIETGTERERIRDRVVLPVSPGTRLVVSRP